VGSSSSSDRGGAEVFDDALISGIRNPIVSRTAAADHRLHGHVYHHRHHHGHDDDDDEFDLSIAAAHTVDISFIIIYIDDYYDF
jgi:hypothetical protein